MQCCDRKAIVGRDVRRPRQQKGLTQEQLAFEAEIDLTYVGGIERGRRNPSLLVMARISIVPASLERVRMDGLAYRRLQSPVRLTAPLILLSRRGDSSAVVKTRAAGEAGR
jgi:transcriptional regulator with XRE-family HTH domain